MKRLLLLSNSTNFGRGYLDHAIDELRDFFGPSKRVAFVPFALFDQDGYTAKARQRLVAEGIELAGLTPDAAGRRLLESAQGVFVGGGNTFRLLLKLQRSGLLPVLRDRVLQGLPYLGASAGTNIAAPSIKTTNDMPIVQPESFEALGLLPFQINPHYPTPIRPGAHGETREARLAEFLETPRRWWGCARAPGSAPRVTPSPWAAPAEPASSAAVPTPKSAGQATRNRRANLMKATTRHKGQRTEAKRRSRSLGAGGAEGQEPYRLSSAGWLAHNKPEAQGSGVETRHQLHHRVDAERRGTSFRAWDVAPGHPGSLGGPFPGARHPG